MNAPKLRRCPCCGSAPHPYGIGHWIACRVDNGGCGLTGPVGDSPSRGRALWNALPRRKRFKRAKAERAVDRLIEAAMRHEGALYALSTARKRGDFDLRDSLATEAGELASARRARLMRMLTGEKGGEA